MLPNFIVRKLSRVRTKWALYGFLNCIALIQGREVQILQLILPLSVVQGVRQVSGSVGTGPPPPLLPLAADLTAKIRTVQDGVVVLNKRAQRIVFIVCVWRG